MIGIAGNLLVGIRNGVQVATVAASQKLILIQITKICNSCEILQSVAISVYNQAINQYFLEFRFVNFI